jgi:SAM-dependent methyltransferase
LFEFTRSSLDDTPDTRILSFGCSCGDEVFTLRRYFADATLRGIDVNPSNIAECEKRARATRDQRVSFAAAATTVGEPDCHYEAIFCLAVLCHGDLVTLGARRADPLIQFADFERIVSDFCRCLKPGGLLLLHTSNFRFCDTAVAEGFDTVLEADPLQLAPDAVFDRDNHLMEGVRYRAVGFRKRGP